MLCRVCISIKPASQTSRQLSNKKGRNKIQVKELLNGVAPSCKLWHIWSLEIQAEKIAEKSQDDEGRQIQLCLKLNGEIHKLFHRNATAKYSGTKQHTYDTSSSANVFICNLCSRTLMSLLLL